MKTRPGNDSFLRTLAPITICAAAITLLSGCTSDDLGRPPVHPDPSGNELWRNDVDSYLMQSPVVRDASFSRSPGAIPGDHASRLSMEVTTDDVTTLSALVDYASRLLLAATPTKSSTYHFTIVLSYAPSLVPGGCSLAPPAARQAARDLPFSSSFHVASWSWESAAEIDFDVAALEKAYGQAPIAIPPMPSRIKSAPFALKPIPLNACSAPEPESTAPSAPPASAPTPAPTGEA
jgi:hypothetical protein